MQRRNRRPRRIVHLITSLEVGGAQIVLQRIISGLSDQHVPNHAYEHEVWYVHDGPTRTWFEERGIVVRQLSGWVRGSDPTLALSVLWRLWRTRPDVVHTMLWLANTVGTVAGWLLRIPVVASFHNHKRQDGRIRNTIDRLLCRLPKQMVAVSHDIKQSAISLGFAPDRIRVIRNGIDGSRIAACMQHKNQNKVPFAEDNCVIFGTVGRLEPVKELDLLLRQFAWVYARCPQARLLIVGSGSQEAHLRGVVVDCGLEAVVCIATGACSTEYLPFFDCFVLSSSQECNSLALLEAMSCAVCCVVRHRPDCATPAEQHPVCEEKETGRVVCTGGQEQRDTYALARVLLEIAQNKSVRAALGARAAHAVTSEFSERTMVEGYRKIFSSCHFTSP